MRKFQANRNLPTQLINTGNKVQNVLYLSSNDVQVIIVYFLIRLSQLFAHCVEFIRLYRTKKYFATKGCRRICNFDTSGNGFRN